MLPVMDPDEPRRESSTAPVDRSSPSRRIIVSLVKGLALNAAIPVACYWLAKRFISSSELTALGILLTTLGAVRFPSSPVFRGLLKHADGCSGLRRRIRRRPSGANEESPTAGQL
jgi:hypothetical protein